MTKRVFEGPGQQNQQEFLLKKVCGLGLQRKNDVGMILRFLDANPDDSVLLELLDERIREEEILNTIDPNPFRSTVPFESLPGSILIGRIRESEVLYLTTPEMLTNHILATGRSGGGKTNLILLLLAQLLEQRQ